MCAPGSNTPVVLVSMSGCRRAKRYGIDLAAVGTVIMFDSDSLEADKQARDMADRTSVFR